MNESNNIIDSKFIDLKNTMDELKQKIENLQDLQLHEDIKNTDELTYFNLQRYVSPHMIH